MSANVETMFYNREVPWHGLGTRVEDALSSEEAIRVAGLDWDVVSVPLLLENTKEIIPDVFANVRNTDNKFLGIVTKRYQIVQNREAFSFTDALLNRNVRYETAGSLDGGKRVWLLAHVDNYKLVGEDYESYLCFTNSYDGKSSVRVVSTNVRVVCQNTLNLALKNAPRSWSTKHIGNMDDKLQEASRALDLNYRYVTELGKVADTLANSKMTEEDVVTFVNGLFPLDEELSERHQNNVLSRRNGLLTRYFDAPDLKKFNGTKWGVIQAVSDFVYHAEPLRKTATREEALMKSVLDGDALLDEVYELIAA